MKTRKILASLLAVLMLFSVFSVAAFAADETTTEKPLKYTFKLTSGPTKTQYYDYEKFDPNGIVVTITDAATGSTVDVPCEPHQYAVPNGHVMSEVALAK